MPLRIARKADQIADQPAVKNSCQFRLDKASFARPQSEFTLEYNFRSAIFIENVSGNLFTLDWVVCKAANADNSKNAVKPIAITENVAIVRKSKRNPLKLCQRHIS